MLLFSAWLGDVGHVDMARRRVAERLLGDLGCLYPGGAVASPVRPGCGRPRGLPRQLAAAPALACAFADILAGGSLVCGDLLGLVGGDRVPSLSQITYGVPRCSTVQTRSARSAATTQQALRWEAPRSVICR
jgi:hypothetical protein